MIIYEDKSFERILFSGFCDTAIPFSVRINSDGEVIISTLPSLKKLAQTFEKRFNSSPLSRDAHEFLRENLRPFMFEHGFCDNRASRKIVDIYTLEVPPTDNASSAQTMKLTSEDIGKYTNMTSAPLCDLTAFGHTVFAVVSSGKIVAVAYTDLNPDGTSAVEIGVETAVAHRYLGYAKAVCKALISELLQSGVEPIYITSRSNRASKMLAKSLGFKLSESEYNYVFRRM